MAVQDKIELYSKYINFSVISYERLIDGIKQAENLIYFENQDRVCYWFVFSQLNIWEIEQRGAKKALVNFIEAIREELFGTNATVNTYSAITAYYNRFIWEPSLNPFIKEPDPSKWNNEYLTNKISSRYPLFRKICIVLLAIFTGKEAEKVALEVGVPKLPKYSTLTIEEVNDILSDRIDIKTKSNRVEYFTESGTKIALFLSKRHPGNDFLFKIRTDYFEQVSCSKIYLVVGFWGVITIPIEILLDYVRKTKDNNKGKDWIRLKYRNSIFLLHFQNNLDKDLNLNNYFVPSKQFLDINSNH